MESNHNKLEKDFRFRGIVLGSFALMGAFVLNMEDHNIAAFITAVYGVATTVYNGAHYTFIELIENVDNSKEIV